MHVTQKFHLANSIPGRVLISKMHTNAEICEIITFMWNFLAIIMKWLVVLMNIRWKFIFNSIGQKMRAHWVKKGMFFWIIRLEFSIYDEYCKWSKAKQKLRECCCFHRMQLKWWKKLTDFQRNNFAFADQTSYKCYLDKCMRNCIVRAN